MDSKSSDDQDVFKDMPPAHAVKYQTLSLTDINSEDATFRITTRTDFNDLLGSIEKIGLLHPPVLMGISPAFIIVCGFRRIAACRRLGWSRIPARIFDDSVDRFKMAWLAIADNALQRSLNLVETSRALNLLSDLSPDKQQLKEAAVTLGLPISPAVVPKVKKICRLPFQIQEGILADTINLSMALELGELDRATGESLVWLFAQLKVGLNKQRELLLLLKEIARREDISIQQLIIEKPMQEILKNAELDRAVKRQKIKSYLRQRRYPTISKVDADYKKRVKQLKLGNDIKLIPPKHFEGTVFTMTLRFNNRKKLKDLNQRIEKIIQRPALGKILD